MAVLAGVGAAIGALGRYGSSQLVTKLVGTRWPLATLVINWSGSLLLGVLTGWQVDYVLTVILGTGILGGFTTYSTFSHEVVMLVDQRRWGAALSYLLLSVGVGVVLAGLGVYLGAMLGSGR
ncbi:chromosome condensation protein [Levilactobacillus koreensis]|uniref:Fluoride-specific ion channel FluC n=2 Tax=Levilactobacillus koreensis TaxID=637971 RepID=A0AAC8UX46_9LACO|nr:chromosome condensation protein [Levilactobacillus koreensis]